MKDLFGQDSDLIDYKKYIGSQKWKAKRDKKLEQAGYRCEKCGVSKYSKKLEVHHLNYGNLGNEKLSELIVLCKECHEKADTVREKETREIIEYKRKAGALDSICDPGSKLRKGFEGWLNNRYGTTGWGMVSPIQLKKDYRSFLHWIKVL
jgi:hypothetical protein